MPSGMFMLMIGHYFTLFFILLMAKENVEATNVSVAKLKSSYNFGKSFLGLNKCNACVGTSACKKFFKEEIRFQNWLAPHLQLPPPDLQSYFGNYSDDGESWRPVEISRMSSKRQHDLSDQRICNSFTKRKTCSIEGMLRRTERFQKWMAAKRLTPDLVQGLPVQVLRCPSQRLLDRIIRRYSEVFDAGSVYMTHLTDKDRLRLLYTLSVNTHPIVLQIFPTAEGWPFLHYLGSCGRLFVSASTLTLSSFNISGSDVAADLAYQLLQIIHHLSANDLNYFFYFTSIDETTFGIFRDGRMFIRDTSKMGIIDKQQDQSEYERKNEETDVFSCLSSDCPPTLLSCANITEKQNIILVCKDLLPYLIAGKFPDFTQKKIDRLLKDCPNNIANDQEARTFTNELMEILRPWRRCDARFAYRYPDCKYNSIT
ncbi:divergent protein kinase domain 2B [Bufo gargarizans]|uniref:divergent protein kinase domain 2B n=1 Tax=Bufo gargarizans TaxID=30331 RepID=UPI001CF24F7F|nr:divergent protein kinase domain 2B [Bufo gargarizans]